MTDVDADKVWALCRQTKSAGANLKTWPPTDKQSAWYKIGVELGVIAGQPPPPPPPPPPSGAFGSAVVAAFPWVQNLYAAALGQADSVSPGSPASGTQSNPHVADGLGGTFGPSAIRWKDKSWFVIQNVSRLGGGTGDPDGRGDDDGFDMNGCDHLLLRLIQANGLKHPDKVQGIAGHAEQMAVLGAIFKSHGTSGNTRSHPVYISTFTDLLLMSVLADVYSGYGLHAYPGPSKRLRGTHLTLLRSGTRSGGVLDPESGAITDAELHNSIIAWQAVEAYTCKGGTKITLFDTALYGNPKNGLNVMLGPGCKTGIDPQLDASGKPQNPDVIAMGDRAWGVPHDCRGVPITRSIGAVAV